MVEASAAPATLEQLEKLGGDGEFVLASLRARHSLHDASMALALSQSKTIADLKARLAAAAGAGSMQAPAAPTGGKPPVTGVSGSYPGAAGVDPEADWHACENIRKEFGGNKSAFLNFARQCLADGETYLVDPLRT
jgi:hypothetical protein